MRIAYVNQDPGIRPDRAKGAAVHVQALTGALRELGAEVVHIDDKDDRSVTESLLRTDAVEPLELIFERYALGARAGSRFACGRQLPHVLEVNAPLLDEAARHRGASIGDEQLACERETFRGAHCILAVSTSVARYVESRGVPGERILVRPNGVDTALFQPRSSHELRARLGIPNTSCVLGFHGRLRPWHGYEALVELLRGLIRSGRDVHLFTVGEGDFEGPLDDALFAGRHTSVGWVPHAEVARHVACFDVLALTYSPDQPCYFSPLKLAEAMASGVVPVVPDLGDLPALVRDGVDGIVYPGGDVDRARRAIELLIDRPGRRERLARAAVATARGRSWASIAAEVLACARREVGS